MAMPPGMESAKMLKDMKKGKKKPEDKPDAGGGDVLADIDKALGDTAEGDDELAKADDEMAEAEMGGVGAPPRGDAGGGQPQRRSKAAAQRAPDQHQTHQPGNPHTAADQTTGVVALLRVVERPPRAPAE